MFRHITILRVSLWPFVLLFEAVCGNLASFFESLLGLALVFWQYSVCPWHELCLFCLVNVSLGSLVAVNAKIKTSQKQQQQTPTK